MESVLSVARVIWYLAGMILTPPLMMLTGVLLLFQGTVLIFKDKRPAVEIILTITIGMSLLLFMPIFYWLASLRQFSGDFLAGFKTLVLPSLVAGVFFVPSFLF